MRYPREIQPGLVCDDIVTNVDFAPTFLDLAGVDIPDAFQGRSFRPLFNGQTPQDWQQSMYYRYWMNAADHNVPAHYGVRTKRYKLIYFYADACGQFGALSGVQEDGPDEFGRPPVGQFPRYWELYDLHKDPREMHNVYDDPDYADVRDELTAELARLQQAFGDEPYTPAE